MADQQLRVVITADASGVGPGVAEATAAVQASADQIAAAQANATAATKALADAQIKLGAAAEAGNGAAAAIIAEYAEASAAATAAVEAMTAAQVQNTAATVADTVAQAADTKVTYNRMEAMGSARVMMGAMDGSMGMMAGGLGRLAAGSQVLGPLMQSMIPVAIMAAGVFLLYDLGEAIYKAFDLGGEAAREFAEQLQTTETRLELQNASLVVQNDKLDDEIAKIEGKPKNSLKDSLDEAAESALKLEQRLEGDIQAEMKLLKMQGMAGSWEQRLLGLQPGTSELQRMLEEHNVYLGMAVTQQDKLNESNSYGAVLEQRLTDLKKQENDLIEAAATSGEEAIYINAAATDKDIQNTQHQIDLWREQNRQISLAIDNENKKDQLTSLGGKTGGKTATDNLPEQIAQKQIELAHAKDSELSADMQIRAELQKQIELDALKEQYSTQGTAAERATFRVLEDQIAIQKEQVDLAKLSKKEVLGPEPPPLPQSVFAGLEGKQQLTPQEQAQQTDSSIMQQVDAKQRLYEQDLRNIEAEERLGRLTGKQAEQEALKLQRQAEQAELAPLASRQKTIAPLGPFGLNEQELKEYEDLQRKMDQITQRGADERMSIEQRETLRIEEMFKKVGDTMQRDFEKAFNAWLTKSQTASQAFGHMLGEMELQVIDFVMKTILEHELMWAELKIEQALGIETMKAQQAAANLATITKDAKTAAANAYQWASAWGGPPAGAIAAALAFTAVEAFGVFDTGGMMPHMGFAFNTSGSPERVLSPSQTHNFESLVNNGGSRSAVLHQTNNYGGAPTKEMHEAQTAHTINRLKSMLRPEAFV